MRKILITGGAGFIGSHVVEHFAKKYPDAQITVLDKMTYAGDVRNLDGILDWERVRLIVGDVSDLELCGRATKGVDFVIHMAAESHVDNSFGNSLLFTHSNVLGTHALLEAARVNKVPRFLHVSTDEVYGDIPDGLCSENHPLSPTNPYSASKAGAEMIAMSYVQSFKMPIMILRANNAFGVRQYPEKIIPRFSLLAHNGYKMTIHGDGSNLRRYLPVEDFATAISTIYENGVEGEAYNVGSHAEHSNNQVAQMICSHLGLDPEKVIDYVSDRPFNDTRYAVETSKIEALGWQQSAALEERIGSVIDWYKTHQHRYSDLLDTFKEAGIARFS